MKFSKVFVTVFISIFAIIATGCNVQRAELGTKKNPIKLFFVPSVDAKMLKDKAVLVKDFIEKETGLYVKVNVPSSYVAVVEAFGTKRADIAALNTFGYILANEKYGAEAKLTVLRYGQSSYKSQIIARADSTINSVKDINNKKFAYVDPASTSGYLLPAKLFTDNKVKPSETMFAQKHDNVVTMVYQGQVDAGATFYSPEAEGKIQDARRLVKTQFPDVEKKVKIVQLTEAIPNDPIVFRKGLDTEIKNKITDSFLKFVSTDTGRETFKALYGVTALKKATDTDYDGVREMLKSLGKSASTLVSKK